MFNKFFFVKNLNKLIKIILTGKIKIFYRNQLAQMWTSSQTGIDQTMTLYSSSSQYNYLTLFGANDYFASEHASHVKLWGRTLTDAEMSSQVFMPTGRQYFWGR